MNEVTGFRLTGIASHATCNRLIAALVALIEQTGGDEDDDRGSGRTTA